MNIEIYDTTLRDGEQGAGISFTDDDRVKVIHALDLLGVSYIEAGNSAALSIFERADVRSLRTSVLVAFSSTRKPRSRACDDAVLRRIGESDFVRAVTIYGKSSKRHVESVLRTTADENLRMIADTVSYLTSCGKVVFYDAEHFFDGYGDDPVYAMTTLEAARNAGASRLVLCDTNGGMLPDALGVAVSAAAARFPGILGIHCHNDMGMAAACSVGGILSGAIHVQGTISGIGERCGNANLNTIIPVLQLKLGYKCIPDESLDKLTGTARYINEIANRSFDEHEPFVGGYAFSHKAGTHIDAVGKTARAFEHIDPERVGNLSQIIISKLSGKAALKEKIASIGLPPYIGIEKNSEEVGRAVSLVKEYENAGYTYEDAEASLELVIMESFGLRKSFFSLKSFEVTSRTGGQSSASVKIAVENAAYTEESASEMSESGPVHALDAALRKVLLSFYPQLESVRLCDYKVRVINSGATTDSTVRVLIESTDSQTVWRTIGVSKDIIDASWQALRDAYEYKLAMQ